MNAGFAKHSLRSGGQGTRGRGGVQVVDAKVKGSGRGRPLYASCSSYFLAEHCLESDVELTVELCLELIPDSFSIQPRCLIL
jgi:hypothetical protein